MAKQDAQADASTFFTAQFLVEARNVGACKGSDAS